MLGSNATLCTGKEKMQLMRFRINEPAYSLSLMHP